MTTAQSFLFVLIALGGGGDGASLSVAYDESLPRVLTAAPTSRWPDGDDKPGSMDCRPAPRIFTPSSEP
jgi:hypothetical protein